MGKLRCPHCGSKDCKERVITFDKVAAYLTNFGEQAAKSFFTGGKMDYQKAYDGAMQDRAWDNAINKKRAYRCKTCGYTWES